MQTQLFQEPELRSIDPFNRQLLKWVGNKQRFAHKIAAYFPPDFRTYYEPFVGSGAILATISPARAFASDAFKPLVEIWQMLKKSPKTLKQWYSDRWLTMTNGEKIAAFEKIKASFNANPNGADLLFLCRSCYGGVVRFRQSDGYISTPCGIHTPISPESFALRVDEWHRRTKGASFHHLGFEDAMEEARTGDLIYCDPPYSHSQTILYGAQSFSLKRLMQIIARCKERGVYVALSIDGTKRSGDLLCDLEIPDRLFERQVFINCGRSMLKRFQMDGQSLNGEVVADRLLLSY